LLGDLIVTGVCGEIGQEPVDEFEAPAYLSKEVGTRYLITHGVIGDYAVVAEATDFGVTWVEAGKAFFKITVLGGNSRYTPYIDHPLSFAENGNALIRAVPVIERIEDWARRYEKEHTYNFEGGSCVPKVNIGAIRGGQPFIPIVTAEKCFLYLDVRITPLQTAMEVQAELLAELDALDVPTALECTLYRRGFEAVGVEPLLGAVRKAHRGEFGDDPGEVETPLSSMWRDTNPFNELGIPAVTYGPASGVGGGLFFAKAQDFTKAARVYARTALDICRRTRGG
jgi:acetylornithine deacetylase/succinyl-diaminopimelate desuccinylase-like protein